MLRERDITFTENSNILNPGVKIDQK